MGQKNNALCSYLSDPVIFADFINGSILNGEKRYPPGSFQTGRRSPARRKERCIPKSHGMLKGGGMC